MPMPWSAVEEPDISGLQKTLMFLRAYWRGLTVIFTPIIFCGILYAVNLGKDLSKQSLCALVVMVVATFWVTEAMPLTVTSFIPLFAFPMLGIMDSASTCKAYLNDTVIMFLGSLFLAYAIELSGLHVRLALCAIRTVGYSHTKMLFALAFITMFVSMWITNTAATTMMVPIIFAILRVLEEQGMGQIYKTVGEDRVPSDITVCYFCTATYSATIGGIGTLVGTGTNLAFKGIYMDAIITNEDPLSFPKFSAFTVPYMLAMEIALYAWMVLYYFGLFRPSSKAAKSAQLPPEGVAAAKQAVEKQWKELGGMTFHEYSVLGLFILAMALFFCRWPGIFRGWADIVNVPENPEEGPKSKFILDSAPAMLVVFLMCMLPSAPTIMKYCTVKYKEELPKKGPIVSVLDFNRTDKIMPWGFAFLLGAGFSLSTAARETNLDEKLGDKLSDLSKLPELVIILLLILITVFMTNFASNVAVAVVVCPIAMSLASKIGMNQLWVCTVVGLSASHCFMLPVGTPGNLIVQGALGMPTRKMIEAGSGITVMVILITWAFMTTYYHVIFS